MIAFKFNKYERVAGFLVFTTILGILATLFATALQQGWFEKKYYYKTTFESGEGLHQGTLVQMSGLKIGAVEKIKLKQDNSIQIEFYVLGQFKERIREDSYVRMLRPFVIGERVLDITSGSDRSLLLAEGREVPSVESFDLMNMLSGKKINSNVEKIIGVLENFEGLVMAFLDKNRTQSMVRIFDRMDPLLRDVNLMTKELTHLSKKINRDDHLENMMYQLTLTLTEINKILPELNRENPQLGKEIGNLTGNLNQMSTALTPLVKQVEGDVPKTWDKMVEALNETVIVLKAMQKSFLMKSYVDEVRQESESRKPASKELEH